MFQKHISCRLKPRDTLSCSRPNKCNRKCVKISLKSYLLCDMKTRILFEIFFEGFIALSHKYYNEDDDYKIINYSCIIAELHLKTVCDKRLKGNKIEAR